MAITAVIAVEPSTASPNQQVAIACTISNSGGSDVEVTGIRPYARVDASNSEATAVNCGQPPFAPASDMTVPAGGDLVLSWFAVGFKPEVDGESFVYDMGAVIETSDGSVTTATVGELTVEGNL